jgi:hypothetical protein
MGMFDDLIPAAGNGQRKGLFDDLIPAPAPQEAPYTDAMGGTYGATVAAAPASAGTLAGAGKALASGLDLGVAQIAGFPADIGLAAQGATNWARSKITGHPIEQVQAESDALPGIPRSMLEAAGSHAMHAGSPLAYEPQTPLEKGIHTTASFLPAAALTGPGGVVDRTVRYGLLPGMASETAGQLTEGTAAEPWARAGAAMGTGLAGAMAARPSQVERTVSRATRGMTAQQADAAEALFQEAQAHGINLSRPEAVQAVTNGATRLGDLQRVVEGQGGMKGFYADRPAQNEAAARQVFEGVTPATPNPGMIGAEAQRGAEQTITGATDIVNRATRPLYDVSDRTRVGLPVHQANTSDPLFARTLEEVRANPALNRTIENLPDDSGAVIDLVLRRMGEQSQNARVPGQASTSNLAAANYADAQAGPRAALETATGSGPQGAGAYERARQIQSDLRRQYVEPLMRGPLGKMAETPETKAAIEALFPTNPLPNSAGEAATAVSALAQRGPQGAWAARQLVRAHMESTFNEAAQALQSGQNQWGGAGFAAVLRGNPQQAQNLEAVVRALPNGDAVWPGVDRFLTILEAQGNRQRIGSQTSFNTEMLGALKKEGLTETTATMAAGLGTQLPRRLRDAIEGWRLGRNVDDLARLFTDPNAAQEFRRLALAPDGSTKAIALAGRLTALGLRGRKSTEDY